MSDPFSSPVSRVARRTEGAPKPTRLVPGLLLAGLLAAGTAFGIANANPAWGVDDPVPAEDSDIHHVSGADIADDERAQEAIAAIEDYLNAIGSARTEFTQYAANGAQATGTLALDRPGRMRLDYEGDDTRLVANYGRLMYYDARLGQVSYMSVESTPAYFLVQEDVRFDGDIEVTEYMEDEDRYYVRLVKAAEPEAGEVTLIFRRDPVALEQWFVVDAQGQETHVVLGEFERDVAFERNMFSVSNPTFRERMERQREFGN